MGLEVCKSLWFKEYSSSYGFYGINFNLICRGEIPAHPFYEEIAEI